MLLVAALIVATTLLTIRLIMDTTIVQCEEVHHVDIGTIRINCEVTE